MTRGAPNPASVAIRVNATITEGSLKHGGLGRNSYGCFCKHCGEWTVGGSKQIKYCKKPECQKAALDERTARAKANQKKRKGK